MIGGMAAVSLVGRRAAAARWRVPLAVAAAGVVGLLRREARDRAGAATPADVVTLIIITIGVSLFLRGLAQVRLGQGRAPRCRRSPATQPIALLGATHPAAEPVGAGRHGAGGAGAGAGSSAARCSARRCAPPPTTRWRRSWWASTRAACCSSSFGLAAALGALGGVLIAPITFTSYDVGIMLGLKGFAAAMLGGLGSFGGAVAGGLMLGLLESLGAGFVSSAYKDAIAFVVILGGAVLHAGRPGRCPPQRTCLSARTARRAAGWVRRLASARTGGLLALALVLALLPLVLANNYFYDVAILVALNAIVCVGPEPADRLRRADQPRPRRLLRARRLRQRDPGRALRLAGAGCRCRLACAAVGAAGLRRRPADAAPEGPLPGDGDAGPGHHRLDRARPPRTASPAAPTAWRCRRWCCSAASVQGERCGTGSSACVLLAHGVAGAQPDRLADRPRAARAARLGGRGRDGGHRQRAAASCGSSCMSARVRRHRRRADRALRRLHHAGQGLVPALGRTGHHGRVRRHGLDLRRGGRRRGADRCCRSC